MCNRESPAGTSTTGGRWARGRPSRRRLGVLHARQRPGLGGTPSKYVDRSTPAGRPPRQQAGPGERFQGVLVHPRGARMAPPRRSSCTAMPPRFGWHLALLQWNEGPSPSEPDAPVGGVYREPDPARPSHQR